MLLRKGIYSAAPLETACLGNVLALWLLSRPPQFPVQMVSSAERPSSLRCVATTVGRLTRCLFLHKLTIKDK